MNVIIEKNKFDVNKIIFLDSVKNNKPIKVDSDQVEILSRIQAKVLILTVQP